MANTPLSTRTAALYLGVVQFFFVSTWTVYAIFLPGLLEAMGIGKHWTAWLLMADQLMFLVFDIAAGFAADRVQRLHGRVAPWIIGATTISCVAFLMLPHLPGSDGAPWRLPAFVILTAVWAITSSALRAPAFTLISRYAAAPQKPALAGLALAGMAVAGAIAPYVGVTLRHMDPRLPFAVSSLALLALTFGLVWAERTATPASKPEKTARPPSLRSGLLFPAIAGAALAYQILFNLNAAPRYLQDATPENLVWLMPVFWIGFNGAVACGGWITRQIGAARLFVGACAMGALAAAAAAYLPGLAPASSGQLIGGIAWGAILLAAFGLVGELGASGDTDRQATLNGLLFSMLALATLTRIGINASGLPQRPEMSTLLGAVPWLLWLMIAVIVAKARRPEGASLKRF
jgi:MFS family permease